jgi:hypothetical protein
MPPELVDELLGINGQEPLRVPCDPQPAANSYAALQEWNAANVTGRNDDRGRNHRDTIAGTCQGDGRVRSPALKEHAWPNARNPACSLEPITRWVRRIPSVGKLGRARRLTRMGHDGLIRFCAQAAPRLFRQRRPPMG